MGKGWLQRILAPYISESASLPAGKVAEKRLSCVELQNMNFDVPFQILFSALTARVKNCSQVASVQR